jgi:hypothetical protein
MKRILLGLVAGFVLTVAASTASAAHGYGCYYPAPRVYHAPRYHAYRVQPHYYQRSYYAPRYYHRTYYRPGCYAPAYHSYYPGGVYFGSPHYSFGVHW